MKEENTSGTLRMASVISTTTVNESLAKKAAMQASEVLFSMRCTDKECPYHSTGGKNSDFRFGFVYGNDTKTVGVLSFTSKWWCCDKFMTEVETACLNTLYQYFGESEVEVTPDHYYQ